MSVDFPRLIEEAAEAAKTAPKELYETTYRVVLSKLIDLSAAADKGEPEASPSAPRKERSRGRLSPAEFIRQKRPRGGTQLLVALAIYLDRELGEAEFTLPRINRLAVEARLTELHPQRITDAVKQGLITTGGARGSYRITQSGESKVESMSTSTKQRS
jgi:hypothetical protein